MYVPTYTHASLFVIGGDLPNQNGEKIPNGHEIYQIAVIFRNGHWIYVCMYKHFTFKGTPNFTQISIFSFENIPFGNPGDESKFRFIPLLHSLEDSLSITLTEHLR
jgi:hypothetical protein